MPGPILIVEDEPSAARVLAALCAELGLSVRTTASGREAQELAEAAASTSAPFSAAIVDLVLAELDGFQFATAARASAWGRELPLVVISGIYKQLPEEFSARVRPAGYFAKPFEPAALREIIARLTGAKGGPPALEGRLAEKPAAALYVELLRNRATGVLTIVEGETRRLITFQAGFVRAAQSNIRTEAVGAPLVASGAVKQASFDRAVALAKQQGIPLHEALATARVLGPEQLKAALRQQVIDVCVGALSAVGGVYRFDAKAPDAVSQVPDSRTSPVVLVLEGAKRMGAPDLARAWLENHAAEKLTRTAELERELFALKTSWPGESVTPLATNERTVGEILSRVKEPELPLLQSLCLSGLLRLAPPETPAPAQRAGVPTAVESPDDDRGRKFSPAEEAARRMLLGERDHLAGASHYAVLGLEPGAPAEAIKKAYFVQAKRFHSDAFSGLDLGSASRVAEELFARVNEANEVLSSPDKRAEYDVYLDRTSKGLPTDVGAILRAEGLFQKGETLYKMGKFADAEREFREAVKLNDSEAEFHAYLGAAIFRSTGNVEAGLAHVEKALGMDPRLRSALLFTAQMHEAQGDDERARSLLRKALDKDPDFTEAKDQLKRLRIKAEQASKGGLLSRLLKK